MDFGICWANTPRILRDECTHTQLLLKAKAIVQQEKKVLKKRERESTEGAWNLQAQLPRVCYIHKLICISPWGWIAKISLISLSFRRAAQKFPESPLLLFLGMKANLKSLTGHGRCNLSINKPVLGVSREALNLEYYKSLVSSLTFSWPR